MTNCEHAPVCEVQYAELEAAYEANPDAPEWRLIASRRRHPASTNRFLEKAGVTLATICDTCPFKQLPFERSNRGGADIIRPNFGGQENDK